MTTKENLVVNYKGPGKRGHIVSCGHIVADTNVSPFARARSIRCGHKFCIRDTKNVSGFVQKHFESATNVSQFTLPKKHHGQQCVHNNVSSFARALRADSGPPRMNYIASRDQFKPIGIGENLVVNYKR